MKATFELRRRRNAREKGAIALAAALLKPRSSLMNDGSTTFALAEELAPQGDPLWVATSGLNIGERLASVPTIAVAVIGGALRASSFGTSGPLATRRYHN